MKMYMNPEEILNQLHAQRIELLNKSARKYAIDLGVPYPPEVEEIDRQIEKISQQVRTSQEFVIQPQIIEPNYPHTPLPERNIFLEQQHQEKLQRREFKNQRIIASKEDKKIHALNIILEHAELYPEQTSFNIDFYYFNYEDRADNFRLLEKFFETAKVAGCFKSFGKSGYANGVDLGFHEVNIENIKKFRDSLTGKEGLQNKNKAVLESIHLVTATLEPTEVIFVVLNGNFHIPIRFAVKNNNGESAYIKKLYDIAYISNVPGKKVNYDKKLSDLINNGLFKRKPIANFLRTNQIKNGHTLVQKSEDKKILVLKNEIVVKTELIKNIPSQYQSLYIDKTK